MTPEQERALLERLAASVEDAAQEAFDGLVEMIREGAAPRDAVAQVVAQLDVDVAAVLGVALQAAVGASEAAREGPAIRVELSRRLYAYGSDASATVSSLVTSHAQGIADARALAKEIFDGYGFRAPDAEPIQIGPRNPKLPQYLTDLLRASPGAQRDLQRAFARMQVDKLTTPALKAAYSGVLRVIDDMAKGRAAKVLENRLKVAFYERMRYFAQRIAQTELHRAYIKDQAREIMQDQDIEYVQIRRAPGRQTPCICALYTGRDRYGLGAGVYPKARAPRPPMHPFCRCVIAPRLDLTGKKAKPEDDKADRYFLDRVGEPLSARIMGSKAKLDMVRSGSRADDVHNATLNPAYRVGLVGEAA